MTEEEAKKELFELHYWYMSHTPKERGKLYDDYIQKRKTIRKALSDYIISKNENVQRKK